jgi:hypothetical protein
LEGQWSQFAITSWMWRLTWWVIISQVSHRICPVSCSPQFRIRTKHSWNTANCLGVIAPVFSRLMSRKKKKKVWKFFLN